MALMHNLHGSVLPTQINGHIVADGNPGNYPTAGRDSNWALLSFFNLNNLEIGGLGSIDGAGASWWGKHDTRPTMLLVSHTFNTLVHGITLR